MVKHTQKIRRLSPRNCLSVFDHFVGLTLKGLTFLLDSIQKTEQYCFFYVTLSNISIETEAILS